MASDFPDDELETILEWNPQTEYSTENQYQGDFLECLQKNLNSESQGFSPAIWVFEHSGYNYIKKEAGRSFVDIGIDKEIGIDLKQNFRSKTQLNRLVGQVVYYLVACYSCVIIVLWGKVDQKAFDTLKHNLKQIFIFFWHP